MKTWNSILEIVEKRLNKHIFENWFLKVECLSIDEVLCTVDLKANSITRDWINDYYKDLLNHCLNLVGLSGYTIKWITDGADIPAQKSERQHEKISPSSDEDTGLIWKNDTGHTESDKKDISISIKESFENSLNPKYTFDKFVVGSCNQFAHAAALGAAESPGNTYNPLFIYGGTGLGKTHLMHAIGHSIKQNNKNLRVSYFTSEKFMNDLINAIRYEKTSAFREKYRSIDVLLIDDVQFLAGKDRTQNEFFHTFNALHNEQKQIVLTSDCPPRDIPKLEERLHSRFEWGLIADLEPPDLETKVAILKRKADMDGIDLPDDIAIYIAGKIKSNVRELEGSLVRLVAISSLRAMPITKLLAQDALKNIIDSEHPEGLTMERIARVVASHYKLTIEELKAKNNSRAIAFPRQVAMYLCKRLTKHSYPEIGREFGGKHHTTVMHSYEKIDTMARDDRNFHKTINEFIDSLCN
ncbi:MAG: chromosomal replication initiator protein DnaA [Acidobacteria bacterium]|nr:chromosomal replication initiator protein DnaA [Acidobacteriota bacterium]